MEARATALDRLLREGTLEPATPLPALQRVLEAGGSG